MVVAVAAVTTVAVAVAAAIAVTVAVAVAVAVTVAVAVAVPVAVLWLWLWLPVAVTVTVAALVIIVVVFCCCRWCCSNKRFSHSCHDCYSCFKLSNFNATSHPPHEILCCVQPYRTSFCFLLTSPLAKQDLSHRMEVAFPEYFHTTECITKLWKLDFPKYSHTILKRSNLSRALS